MKKIALWSTVFLLLPVALMAKSGEMSFPLPLESYTDSNLESLWDVLLFRINTHSFNLVATLIFFFAIVHAFMAGSVMKLSHRVRHNHEQKMKHTDLPLGKRVSKTAEILHFFGEVEAVFGIWCIPLTGAFVYYEGWHNFVTYNLSVNYTEPMFIVVIMALASTKPIMHYSEMVISKLTALLGGSVTAGWFCILTITPLLGSLITEPAAITIGALLLSQSFYKYKPEPMLAYATLGLLFVNISIGGTLTNFAAPPVLMVAEAWQWDTMFMLTNIGWKAVLALIFSTTAYMVVFRKALDRLNTKKKYEEKKSSPKENNTSTFSIPLWILLSHVVFIMWIVFNAHYPVLFISGFLFFIAFAQATQEFQNPINLKNPMLVGFFLAGLITHGGLQAWWIAPTLSRLSELPLFVGSMGLTAFNDNAAITYLATLVPDFTDTMKYAVVTGAVTGGGLTVLANAPNPAGQSILAKHFKLNVNPLKLLLGALLPTAISGLFFYLL